MSAYYSTLYYEIILSNKLFSVKWLKWKVLIDSQLKFKISFSTLTDLSYLFKLKYLKKYYNLKMFNGLQSFRTKLKRS